MKVLSTFIFLAALFVVGCKPSIPSEYIQPGEMEDILYDYQIAQAMGTQTYDRGKSANDIEKNVYKMAVLKKHGISQTQFDNSLQYYLRHTEELRTIYENLAERFQQEAMTLGSSVNDINQFGEAQQGDTTNVWKKADAFILSTNEGLNQETFAIKCDTSYHKGDRLMLNFDSQFIVQDGARDVIAVVAVKFSNDSIAQQNVRATSNSHYTLTICDNERLGIKELHGFFLANKGENDSETTLKLVCLYNVRLVRMHTKEPEKVEAE